jgi:hypothetical protein
MTATTWWQPRRVWRRPVAVWSTAAAAADWCSDDQRSSDCPSRSRRLLCGGEPLRKVMIVPVKLYIMVMSSAVVPIQRVAIINTCMAGNTQYSIERHILRHSTEGCQHKFRDRPADNRNSLASDAYASSGVGFCNKYPVFCIEHPHMAAGR